jgi:hypothetical protein
VVKSQKRASWRLLCLSLTLAGCATAGVRVEATGSGPDLKTAPTFALDLGAADSAARADPALAAAVTRDLRNDGMVEADGSNARILVEVAYTDRPVRVGDYVAAANPAAASGGGQWLTAPARTGLWASPHARVCQLAVRMSVPVTGQELYQVRAEIRPPRQGCGSVAERLADAALRQIPLPPRR